jgi:DNA-binding NtrC family response regulator/tetratricopeptide (TPR) repeat protein
MRWRSMGWSLTSELTGTLAPATQYHTAAMDPLSELIGEDPKIVALRRMARALLQRHQGARRLPPILIQGETGTGKGLLARLMHRAGPRASARFVDLNCAAIPETLLEAELFGYERGAFTDARQSKPGLFQVAHGGTLFLDEIGLLPRGLQAKLLTVLEQGSVRRLGATRNEPANVSIVAATNEPLRSAVLKGRFREDLYHRLAVLTLELPPLRERRDDIELLARRLLAHACAEYNLPAKTLAESARLALTTYEWPGNIRELGNVIERAVLLADTDTITADELDLLESAQEEPRGTELRPTLEDTYRQRLVEALERTSWNISRTAAVLGIARNTVRARMRLYGLRPAGSETTPAAPSPAAAAPIDVTPPSIDHSETSAIADVHWEHRRVTFLRARILFAGDSSPSLTTRVLGWLIEKANTFGGHVSEISQHGIVTIFGHEPAEDAPRRAATAALVVTKQIAREHLHGDLPSEVSVTLAIHVDRVALARIGGRPVIDQEATRRATAVLDELEPIAGGEIGVTNAAVGFLLRHFDVTPSPDAPAGRHRLVGRWLTPGGVHPATFIGRRPEIDMLQGLLDRAMLGQGQIVTLVGDPGIGKSRLLHEFQQSVRREGVITREGHCASYGTHVPYFPAIEILQAVCGIEETDSLELADAKVLAALRPLGDSAVASAPYLQHLFFPRKSGELSDRSPDAIKAGTFEAIRRVVLAQQERRTLLLAVEDLQWIDQTSAELLSSLADLTTATRFLLVATCRPGYQAPWRARSNATQIAVGPLSAAESRQLVESVLAERPATDAVVTRILDRGEGNPLFLEELARSVREQSDGPTALAVPGTVHDIIATRIDGLAPVDKSVLGVAAVIGRTVPVSLLQEASELSGDDVRGSLGRLLAGEFLYATRLGADPEYTFKHTLTHEVAYDSVPVDVRRILHARVANAIQKLAPETRERRPETLARHCTEAGRHAEAIEHWFRAGQLALLRSAHGDAIAHLAWALNLLTGQPESSGRDAQEIAVQLAMATALTVARGYGAPDVERTLVRIRILADRLTDVAQKFSSQWSLWRFQFARANFRAAEELVGELLAIAAGQDDPVVHIAAHVAAGVDKFYLGEFARARKHFAQAIAAYDREQSGIQTLRYAQDLGVAAWGFLGWADAVVGDLDGAARRVETSLQLAREIGHPFSLASALFLACEVYELREETDAVRRLGDELVALSREHGFAFFLAFALTHTGWALSRAGDVSSGVAVLQEGADLFRAVGQRVGLAHRARLVEGLLAAHDVGGALDVIAEALQQEKETEEHAFVAALLALRGEALARRGETAAAARSFSDAIELANRQGATLFALRAAAGLRRLESAR